MSIYFNIKLYHYPKPDSYDRNKMKIELDFSDYTSRS